MSKTINNMPLDTFKDQLAKQMFGKTRAECKEEGICVSCHQSLIGFRDDTSRKEAEISGFCQVCQDSAFKEQ